MQNMRNKNVMSNETSFHSKIKIYIDIHIGSYSPNQRCHFSFSYTPPPPFFSIQESTTSFRRRGKSNIIFRTPLSNTTHIFFTLFSSTRSPFTYLFSAQLSLLDDGSGEISLLAYFLRRSVTRILQQKQHSLFASFHDFIGMRRIFKQVE